MQYLTAGIILHNEQENFVVEISCINRNYHSCSKHHHLQSHEAFWSKNAFQIRQVQQIILHLL